MLTKFFVLAVGTFLLMGCVTYLPLPNRVSSAGPNALAVFKVSASAKFLSGLSYSELKDEPLKLILKDTASGKEFTGQLLLNNFVFFPNLPLWSYLLEKAESSLVFQVLAVSNPVLVYFNEFSKKIDISEEGVSYIASYGITTKQKDLGLNVLALDEKSKTDAETAELAEYINQNNRPSGWSY